MAKEIKGMSITLDSNVLELNNNFKKIADNIKLSGSKLKNFDNNLKFKNGDEIDILNEKFNEYKNIIDNISEKKELLIEKYNQLNKAILETQEALSKTSDTAEKEKLIQKQNKLNKEYEYTKINIDASNRSLNNFNEKLKNTAQEIKNIPFKKFEEFGTKCQEIGKKLSTHITIPILAIKGILTKITVDTAKYAGELKKTSKEIGITAENLQIFRYIAKRTGITSEELEKSFKKLQQGISAISYGISNETTEAFNKLGINIKNNEGSLKDTGTIFLELKKSLEQISDETEKNNLIMDIFGSKLGKNLIPMLALSDEEIKKMTNNIKDLGIVSNENVDKTTILNKKWNEFKHVINITKMNLASALLPVFESLVSFLEVSLIPIIKGITNFFNMFNDTTKKTIFIILGISASLGAVVYTIGKIINVISSLKTLLLGMAKHPILYGVLVSLSALAAGGVWLYNKFNKPPQNINQESQTNNYNKIENKNEFKPTIIIEGENDKERAEKILEYIGQWNNRV
ncbi:phage tail tape measure protein [Spiroplasma phoeniceum]|uniref:Membrane-anchored protein n=2 Tax=Spiroplasma TaxID=2132 RepID=A0A345DPT3_9MOLU|nr:phage tail tape measure protein [Spiroplasma phoeniceum]AXF96176.1 putative membrane-anchored protein [Spiroplasma phoeniceum P40]AXF96221.1 putative membrane-anchored protein [Spiroplasma phoeniceum P40]